jgi:hypothetical protein
MAAAGVVVVAGWQEDAVILQDARKSWQCSMIQVLPAHSMQAAVIEGLCHVNIKRTPC